MPPPNPQSETSPVPGPVSGATSKHSAGPVVPDDPTAQTRPVAAATREAQLQMVGSAENLEFLHRHLRRRHPNLVETEVEDLAESVMTRVIATITAGTWTPHPDPAMIKGYLRKAADWAVVDLYRTARHTREHPVPHEVLQDLVLTDDQAVAVLDQHATTDSVLTALERIRKSGDRTLFQVVTAILDHIQRTGQQPSNRETGLTCGISHTAVAKALVRMRPYFTEARDIARDT
jgi:hypothetical protein